MKRKKLAVVIFSLAAFLSTAAAQNRPDSAVFEDKNAQDSIRIFEETIKQNPDSVSPYYRLAIIFTKLGRHQKAVETFQRVVAIKSNFFEIAKELAGLFSSPQGTYYLVPEAYHNLSEAYINLDRYQEALYAYKEFSERQPELKEPDLSGKYFELGYLFCGQGKVGEGRQALDLATQIIQDYAPEPAKKFCEICNSCNERGHYEDAIQACREALRMKADYSKALLNLGVAYINLDRPKEALKVLPLAGSKTTCAEVHLNAGIAHAALGEYTEERMSYIDALNCDCKPDLPEVHYRLALSYLIDGSKKSALEQFEILKTLDKGLAEKLSVFLDK